jgi:hypothetical protein
MIESPELVAIPGARAGRLSSSLPGYDASRARRVPFNWWRRLAANTMPRCLEGHRHEIGQQRRNGIEERGAQPELSLISFGQRAAVTPSERGQIKSPHGGG